MNDYEFLRKIKRKKTYDFDRATEFEQDALTRLFNDGYVTFKIVGKKNRYLYSITTKGDDYITEKRESKLQWAIPVLISISALLISSLTLVIQLIELIE